MNDNWYDSVKYYSPARYSEYPDPVTGLLKELTKFEKYPDPGDGVSCPSCGCPAEHRTCDTCGAAAWVIDCGCYEQPAPIAANDGSQGDHEYICHGCYEKQTNRKD